MKNIVKKADRNIETTPDLVKLLNDNRLVSVSGYGRMIYKCDCCNKNHLDWVIVESVFLLADKNDLEGKELSPEEVEKNREEINEIIEQDLYSQTS